MYEYDSICGQTYGDVYRMIEYVQKLGYSGFKDFLEDFRHPEEAGARVALYKARLARIKHLTELEV